MKNVKINTLTLSYFKGIRDLEVQFDTMLTTISGENATGKSSVMDAFIWLLFGKDASGRQDFGIKTIDPVTGLVIPMVDHTVTGSLSIDGEELVLSRTFREIWSKTRGQADTKMSGHETLLYVNGVPQKAGEYKAVVDGIIEEQIFKMITNPAYFPLLDKRVQRDILLRIAGGVTIAEIASSKKEFEEIVKQLAGKELAQFKMEISARKLKVKNDLAQIPTRIDEATKSIPEMPNERALTAELEGLKKEVTDTDNTLAIHSESIRVQYKEVQDKQRRINDLKTRQQGLLNEALRKQNEKTTIGRLTRDTAERELRVLETQLKDAQATANLRCSTTDSMITRTESMITTLSTQIAEKRSEWTNVSVQEAPKGDTLLCPLFKHSCTDSQALHTYTVNAFKSASDFETEKISRLEKINDEGRKLVSQMDGYMKELSVLKQDKDSIQANLEKSILSYQATIAEQQEILSKSQAVPQAQVMNGNDVQGYSEIGVEVAELELGLTAIPVTDNTSVLSRKQEVNSRIEAITKQLALKDVITHTQDRIEALRIQEHDLAQQMADLEQREFLLQSLEKARMDEVEKRVNQMFTLVKFRLFEEQINGGEKEDCTATIDGVKYPDLNTASKINAGLDIINTLCSFHGVTAPIFIDNAEAVNILIHTESQLVRLAVSTENLTVKFN